MGPGDVSAYSHLNPELSLLNWGFQAVGGLWPAFPPE